MIRLIVSDVDGTLLRDGAAALSPTLIEQIKKLRTRGMLFCAASGRSCPSLRSLFAPIADDLLFIADDGALTVKGTQILFSSPISEKSLSAVMSTVRDAGEGCVLSYHTYEGLYAFSSEKQTVLRERFGGQTRTLDDPAGISGVFKLGLFRAGMPLRNAVKAQSDLRVSYEDAEWLELSPAGCDKGTALQALQRRLGISRAQTMAFGDNANDQTMLQNAGIAYRMKNSRYDLSVITKNSTDSAEETLRLFFRL